MVPLHVFCISGLVMAVVISAQETFQNQAGLNVECIGNVMKLTIDKSLLFGRHLEVDAVNGSQVVPLSPKLAAKCGYSMETDPVGNTKLFASLLSCYSNNQDDFVFGVDLRLRMHGNQLPEEDVHEIKQTCEYRQWASRQILCERNFMEVSVNRLPPEMSIPRLHRQEAKEGPLPAAPQAATLLNNVWRVVFYTPKEKPMMLEDVQKAGYGISTTPSRLVLRSPYNMPDTYSHNVNGVQMEVLKVTTYFKREWSVTMMDTVAACPTGGLDFSDESITWYMPRYITPLMTLLQYDIIELSMGIDGQKLNAEQMSVMGYSMSLTDTHIIISLPMGGPDGYFMSQALDYVYHTTYSIEPMLEMLWKEGKSDITRYKVHYPITTPPKPQPPHVIDNTKVDSEHFDILVGIFLSDVELLNITFSTGVMSVAEANTRGIIVEKHGFSNGSRAFSLLVPFSDPVVLNNNINHETTTYTLPLIFGFIILPEYTPFAHPVVVEARLQDVTLPTVRGTCDEENFYIIVAYGNRGKNFNIILGNRDVSADLMEYQVKENSTHISMTVPFLSEDVVFELAYHSSIKGRLDVLLWDSVNNWHLQNFSLACNFPMTMAECFSNGTMTALAVKVESVPQLVPAQLTLNDASCTPTFSNNRFAYFSFNASSCGTTRTFFNEVMVYQNSISTAGGTGVTLQDDPSKGTVTGPQVTPEYRLKVSCYYTLNYTQALTFFTKPRRYEPFAESGVGELKVRMKLAKDPSYNVFYVDEDYPVVQFLRQPLYFEVELTQFADPRIELVLENCWATTKDGDSNLSWDLIVNGCVNVDDRYQTTLHPVALDDWVHYPPHLKRFEVKMFTFVKDDRVLTDQIFVHCEAVICDINQTDAICRKQCPTSVSKHTKRARRGTHEPLRRLHVSSGQVLLSSICSHSICSS